MEQMELHVAYGAYFATGEGVTYWIAVGNSPGAAEATFKKHVDPYFHRSMEVTPYKELDESWAAWIPKNAATMFSEREGHYEFFQQYHANFS